MMIKKLVEWEGWRLREEARGLGNGLEDVFTEKGKLSLSGALG